MWDWSCTMPKLPLFLAFILFSFPPLSHAGDAASEMEMFSSPEISTQAADNSTPVEEKKTLGVSGQVTNVLEDITFSTTTDLLNTYILGNILLDARLKNDVKGFANLEGSYAAQTRKSDASLKEMFLDFNFERRAYFRAGKQVLQWGQCYLWNPTDLINIEKKTFVRKIGYREGTYGVKMHIPFGTRYNIYGFLDTDNAPSIQDISGALKFEFLVGKTEMAFSGWTKRSYDPVFGFDFTSRAGTIDIAGELSVSRRDNGKFLQSGQGILSLYKKSDEWVRKASIDFTKGFRLGNFNDRVHVTGEFFYNQTGYTENLFSDKTVYPFASPVPGIGPAGPAILLNGTKKDFLLGNNLFVINYLARYYGAVFTSLDRFLIEEMTLTINYIHNFNDSTGILSTGVSYRNLNDFSAGILVNTALGPANGEYTFSGARNDIQFTLGISF